MGKPLSIQNLFLITEESDTVSVKREPQIQDPFQKMQTESFFVFLIAWIPNTSKTVKSVIDMYAIYNQLKHLYSK